ncbi:hypothetical protein [Elizabethkingia ursingii]|uniref:hypothetical protein n=1 Tax=Elizabethkingia ursingii TaxID=1756150 RepID=UPI001F38D74D|nr:hypothetical protein [Elizabethkingia ursingii]
MIKNLLKASLWGILTLSTLSSCRTEDGAITQKQIEDKRFAVFIPKSGKSINYADGFAFLMKRYDGLQKTNISGINNKTIIGTIANTDKTAFISQNGQSYVEFNVKSQIITEESGDKWIVFPKVQGNRVIGLVSATLTEKGTYIRYRNYNEQDELYKLNVVAFQESLNKFQQKFKTLALSASINPVAGSGCRKENGEWVDCGIQEVIITVPRPNPGTTNPPENGGNGGGCQDHANCIDPGGGGGGYIEPLQDPCSKAKRASANANTLWKNPAIREKALDKLDNLKTDRIEHAVGVGRDANGNPTTSAITSGTSDQVNVESPPGDYVFNAHTHPELNDTPHSGPDLYNVLENILKSPSFVGSFVINSSGTTYGIFVNDRDAVIEFLRKYPRQDNLGRKEFNTSNDIGRDYNNIRDSFSSGRSPSNGLSEQTAGMEAALAYVMDKYNMGVSLLKADKNGNFNGITAQAAKVYDSVNKEYKDGYSSKPCN